MKIQKVTAIYFSPTHGSKVYTEAIAKQLSDDYTVIDLTRPEARCKDYVFSTSDLVVFGAPVYAGRLPVIEGGIFDRIHGDRTPAVFTVSYGNRAFEDALLEEKNICEANGFIGIAAAAWIAPHTFSSLAGAKRPNETDHQKIAHMADKIKELLDQAGESWHSTELCVPGTFPYRAATPVSFHPTADDTCTHCGTCVSVCPTKAIVPDAPDQTDPSKCICCLACSKACPSHARSISHPRFSAIVQRLESNFLTPLEAEVFFSK